MTTCPLCHGTGEYNDRECLYCGGEGRVDDDEIEFDEDAPTVCAGRE